MPRVSDCAEPRRPASESRRLTGCRPVGDVDDAEPRREKLRGRSGVIGVAAMGDLPGRFTSGLKVKLPAQQGLGAGLAGGGGIGGVTLGGASVKGFGAQCCILSMTNYRVLVVRVGVGPHHEDIGVTGEGVEWR